MAALAPPGVRPACYHDAAKREYSPRNYTGVIWTYLHSAITDRYNKILTDITACRDTNPNQFGLRLTG